MTIDTKDIIFGLVKFGDDKTAIVCDTERENTPAILFGALSFIAAHDDSFLEGLKGVIKNVRCNGDKIRHISQQQVAKGDMLMVKPGNLKS